MGSILTRTIGTKTFNYSYNNSAHIHAVSNVTYNGNNYAFSYDANGNLTSGPDLSNIDQVVTRSVTYDADNMPVQIVRSNVTVDFTYDGVGTRIKKVVSDGSTTLYIGAHYEVKDSVITKYIFGGNLRLAVIKGSLTYYYHKDHLGSTGAITDSSGAKVESAEYQPFGTMREHIGSNVSDYKFTDQELDNETGLYNYDARLYDPVLGLFVTPDSIVPNPYDPQSLNRYSYCRNNPLIYTDPSGYSFDSPWPGGPVEGINGKGPLVDPDKKPKDVPSWNDVYKHADKWLKREKTAFGRWLNWGEELRTIDKLIKFETNSFFVNVIDYCIKTGKKVPNHFGIGFSGTLGIISISWDTRNPTKTSIDFALVSIGGSFNIVNKAHTGLENDPLPNTFDSLSLGWGKNLGITLAKDAKIAGIIDSINIGPSIGFPATVSKNITTIDWNKVTPADTMGDIQKLGNMGFPEGTVWP